MPRWIVGALAATWVLAASAAGAQQPPTHVYLAGTSEPNILTLLPPAPQPGSATDKADRAIFRQTRQLQGSRRWDLAVADVDYTVPALLADFRCAVGAPLSPEAQPALISLLQRAAPNIIAAINAPKDYYKRPRPYLVQKGGICVAKSPELAANFDYPSGHAAISWTLGLILAELAPDRSGPILTRARAYGESRVVCGVHNASSVDAGRTTGAALVAALHGDPAFRADLEAARKELAALRASSPPLPDAAACQAQSALIAKTPW